MSDSIELDNLAAVHRGNVPSAEHTIEDLPRTSQPTRDGSISVWAWSSALILALSSICLLTFPRFLLFLAEPSGGRATLTALEKYLALHLGVILGTLAVTIIALHPNEWPTGLHHNPDPDHHPLLLPVTVASLVMALLSFDNRSVGTLTTTVLLASSVVGLWGLWMLVFSGPLATSRKTGADKHTSAFIFGNKNSASVKRKLWKKGNQLK